MVGFLDIARIASAAPHVAEVLQAARRSADDGDMEHLRRAAGEHGYDIADAIVPGLGEAARSLIGAARHTAGVLSGDEGDWIEGEARLVAPWDGFVHRLFATPFGGHIIMGPSGSGKTTLAKRLAERYCERYGYLAEFVNFYPEDVPSFGVPISENLIPRRVERIQAHLESSVLQWDEGEQPEGGDDDEGPKSSAKDKKGRDLPPPPSGRVVVIDEASLSMGVGSTIRKAALAYVANCRHWDTVVIYIAQWSGQLPEVLLGETTVWVKRPLGDEQYADRTDNKLVRHIWSSATEAFGELRRQPYFTEPYLNVKSWAYCRCVSIDGKPGYIGLVPFNLPDQEEVA